MHSLNYSEFTYLFKNRFGGQILVCFSHMSNPTDINGSKASRLWPSVFVCSTLMMLFTQIHCMR